MRDVEVSFHGVTEADNQGIPFCPKRTKSITYALLHPEYVYATPSAVTHTFQWGYCLQSGFAQRALERRHTGYLKKLNLLPAWCKLCVIFLGSPWPSYSRVERLTYIIVQRDKVSSQTGYAYQHSYYFVFEFVVVGWWNDFHSSGSVPPSLPPFLSLASLSLSLISLSLSLSLWPYLYRRLAMTASKIPIEMYG